MTTLIAMPEPALPDSGSADAAHRASLPELPVLSGLLHGARRLPDAVDWRAGVLEALHPGAGRWSPAMLAACALPDLPAGAPVCMVTPLHVVAGISRVHLPPGGRLMLDSGSEAWREAFNREFGTADLQLHAAGNGWVLAAPFAHAAADPAPEMLAGSALAREPAGDEATRSLRRLGAEVEMWLASHALNSERERRHAPPVNCFWFWGGGRAGVPALARAPSSIIGAAPADAWLSGLAARCDVPIVVRERPDIALRAGELIVLVPTGDEDPAHFWPRMEQWLAPAAHALNSRQLPALHLQLGRSAWLLSRSLTAALAAAAPALVAAGGIMSLMVRRLRARAVAECVLPEGLSPLLRRIYAARRVADGAALATDLGALLPVGTLDHVEDAATLLLQHRDGRVLVVGDFDADGATSTALMVHALNSWGFASVDFLVPDRFRFGYGLTADLVGQAAARAPTLIVTVDNGISSIDGVAAARALGMAVLVTDHHLPGEALPDATVIVNPNQRGSGFASRALAGVGVAFYVLAALQRRMQAAGCWPAGARPVTQWLDLVALGTVADLVPLDVNNRVLVAQGIRRMRAGHCTPGVKALLEVAQRDLSTLVAADLGFSAGPRLNAAGRLDDMSIGIRCLLAPDEATARGLAVQLDQLNRQRRQIEGDMQAQAQAAVKGLAAWRDGDRHAGLTLFDAGWHQGVVGLVASRIKDRIGRPVVAFAPAGDDEELRGSARSIPGVHVRDVLESVSSRHPGLVLRFGGHAMAAGLTVRHDDLDRFARAFDEAVGEALALTEPDDVVWTDGELAESEISLSTAELLREAGPWGQAFPEPSFHGEFEVESARVVGEKHVKCWLVPVGSRARFDAIAFNLLDGERFTAPPQGRLRLAYRLDINHWQGERRLQLLIEHVETPL